MNDTTILEILSQCKLGAILLSSDYTVLAINKMGEFLLHSKQNFIGKTLPDFLSPLLEETENPKYINVVFNEYILRHPTPKIETLSPDTKLLVFRDASKEYLLDMMDSVIHRIKEGIVMCDADSRLNFFNDPAVKLDSLIAEDVLGQTVDCVYNMTDDTECALPKVMKKKLPILNHRQRYSTKFGKKVDVVANTYPVIKNGQVIGGFNLVEDWSNIHSLHKQIIDLQEKLVKATVSENQKKKSILSAKYTFEDIIYVSQSMKKLLTQCSLLAKNDSSIMFYGETGTGKELFAQSIHNASDRSHGPFLAINCAALPENLLESILFGSVKGAYTGAENRAGLFEQANRGTLLLDEINSMNINLQAKLLRVLQDGVVRRIGSSEERKVDVRILSCINIPPKQAIEENKLRRDLFYRLGVITIDIPPLRERKEDISILAKHFIMEYNQKMSKNVRGIDDITLELFQIYNWPGNIRELQHVMEHAMIMIPEGISMITPEYIPQHLLSEDEIISASLCVSSKDSSLKDTDASLNYHLQEIEKKTLCSVLAKNHGNISKSAQVLKMSRQNLQYRIKRYGIDIREFKD